MIEISREDLVYLMETGYVYLGMQRFKEAKQVFEGIQVMAPNSEVPIIALGQVDFCQGKFSKAVTKYKKALNIDPDSVHAKAYMGEALFFDNKKDEAIEALKEVVKLDRDGRTANFAQSLLDAIKHGFTPKTLSGVEEINARSKEKTK
ncbi:tetratricopeptide repeat protein [bacterium]|nr:tetratricopeptide repeat protein [bacterium]